MNRILQNYKIIFFIPLKFFQSFHFPEIRSLFIILKIDLLSMEFDYSIFFILILTNMNHEIIYCTLYIILYNICIYNIHVKIISVL